MQLEFVIATNNDFKISELTRELKFFGAQGLSYVEVLGKQLTFPPEGTTSYQANASKKAEFISQFLPDRLVIADDSGIELAGHPDELGVQTARQLKAKYGTQAVNQALINRAVEPSRGFKMQTVIALARNGYTLATYQGVLVGRIAKHISPVGHGLDQILIPAGLDQVLGSLPTPEFVKFDHRSKAVAALMKGVQNVLKKMEF
ncbi:non-canonical purine NTP pyrophosphatase [Lactobacillus alvi]|uniref:Non-canonical purine NTP pyrophosphatase n=1 Tax=Limosilactobacillus alvi TaxID=990412 RepID=A0ABS2EN30_9LACO|nr:non-canonical purine NTP pyrophosphatase [Limosilactobacillus alvi]MBM6753917.1 non-canonical purine NTP pyrophosphatase [Limosilactobacillus alvi]